MNDATCVSLIEDMKNAVSYFVSGDKESEDTMLTALDNCNANDLCKAIVDCVE